MKLSPAADTKIRPENTVVQPTGTIMLEMSKNQLLSPVGYERDIRHYEFEIEGTGTSYEVGDSLGITRKNFNSMRHLQCCTNPWIRESMDSVLRSYFCESESNRIESK